MIVFNCECGKQLQVQDSFAGKQGRCPVCDATFQIPDYETASASPTPPPVIDSELGADDFQSALDEYGDEDQRREAMDRYDSYDDQEEIEVLSHSNQPLSDNLDFFANPPEEIGPITSAHSTLGIGEQPISPAARMGYVLMGAIGGLLVGLVIGSLFDANEIWTVIWALGIPVIIVLIVYSSTGFHHTCTYVGRKGIASYEVKGNRENLTGSYFVFVDATELRASQTKRYTNGAYQGTDYNFVWTDVGGRTIYTVNGTYQSEAGNPPEGDLYHFGCCAEWAWTFHLFEQAQAQLQMSGSIYFGLGGKDWVRLAEGKILLYFKGEESEHLAEDIEEVRIHDGSFQIRRRDAQKGWFSSSGIYKFPYSSLGNAQLFLILLERVVGISFS